MDILNQITEQRDALQKELEKAQARCVQLEANQANAAPVAGGVRTRASGLLGAAASVAAPAPVDSGDAAKFKLRSEKLTANLLACKQVEKELKSEITKLRLELELAKSGLNDKEREVGDLNAPLHTGTAQKSHAPPPSAPVATTSMSQLKRKSLSLAGAKSLAGAFATNEANKENAINH